MHDIQKIAQRVFITTALLVGVSYAGSYLNARYSLCTRKQTCAYRTHREDYHRQRQVPPGEDEFIAGSMTKLDREEIPNRFCDKKCGEVHSFFVKRGVNMWLVFDDTSTAFDDVDDGTAEAAATEAEHEISMDWLFTTPKHRHWQRWHILTINCKTRDITECSETRAAKYCRRNATQSLRLHHEAESQHITPCYTVAKAMLGCMLLEFIATIQPRRRLQAVTRGAQA